MRLFIAFTFLVASFLSVHAAEAASQHNMTITISPFHLLNPELYLTGELLLTPKMSVAAMMGAGKITDEGKTSGIWEAGAQFRYYIIGSFTHGIMVGADAGYVDANAQIENPTEYLVGAHAGGFLGYKYSMKGGFAAEVQIGPVYLWGESAEASELQTLHNFKAGWSF